MIEQINELDELELLSLYASNKLEEPDSTILYLKIASFSIIRRAIAIAVGISIMQQ